MSFVYGPLKYLKPFSTSELLINENTTNAVAIQQINSSTYEQMNSSADEQMNRPLQHDTRLVLQRSKECRRYSDLRTC